VGLRHGFYCHNCQEHIHAGKTPVLCGFCGTKNEMRMIVKEEAPREVETVRTKRSTGGSLAFPSQRIFHQFSKNYSTMSLIRHGLQGETLARLLGKPLGTLDGTEIRKMLGGKRRKRNKLLPMVQLLEICRIHYSLRVR